MSRWPMREVSRAKVADPSLGDKVHKATLHSLGKRAQLLNEIPEWEELRAQARQMRLEALDRHRELREQLVRGLERRGTSVTIAQSTEQACEHIVRLVLDSGGKVTKSKSMTSEEIGLNGALEKAGAQVTETDLGELIVQLAGQTPSHVTAPAVHLSVEDVARIFQSKLGIDPPAWIRREQKVSEAVRHDLARQMSLAARKVLRERFLQADVGISGANFLVAQSGTIVLVENEGNIQLTTCLPKRHIVLAGIDKIVARDADLAVLLRLLPASATGQRQSCYVSLVADRHEDRHVVLLDHGRTALMDDAEHRDLLTCIRCGACMNVCPVYRNIGGHAYGGAYPGPIGSLLLPFLEQETRFRDLPFASSLCGACTEVCPVAIPLHERLLQLRARLTRHGLNRELHHALRAATYVLKDNSLTRLASSGYPAIRALAEAIPVTGAWTATRDLPPAPSETFRDWYWRERQPELPPTTKPTSSPTGAHAPPEQAEPPNTSLADRKPTLDRFALRLQELGPSGETELHHFPTSAQALAFLRGRLTGVPPKTLLVQGEPSEKRDYQVGITSAALLLADSGGVVLDLRTREQGRTSTLVETHFVVAESSKLVGSLADLFEARSTMRASGAWGDYQVVVTGPSRTADIEKVLVIPAHGPQRLVVVLCDEPVDVAAAREVFQQNGMTSAPAHRASDE